MGGMRVRGSCNSRGSPCGRGGGLSHTRQPLGRENVPRLDGSRSGLHELPKMVLRQTHSFMFGTHRLFIIKCSRHELTIAVPK